MYNYTSTTKFIRGRCSYLNMQFVKFTAINRKGTFAPLAPPAKRQGGQLPLLPPLVPASLRKPITTSTEIRICIIYAFPWRFILNIARHFEKNIDRGID